MVPLKLLKIILMVAVVTCGQPALADQLRGRVVRVADGDTITLLDADNRQHKIRLAGIDAPESYQAFGEKSRDNLASLVAGQDVAIDGDKLDRYRRRIGKVILNGRDINLVQIQAGFAWHYKKYAKEQSAVDRAAYAKAEEVAQAQRRGLWSVPFPTPPWDFRRIPAVVSP